jgi:hypothetical protein
MDGSLEIRSAVDAVRCLYLARVAEREGHEHAARRMEGKATDWINKHLPGSGWNPCPEKPAT